MIANFLNRAEEYVARYEPDKSAEGIFAEFQKVISENAEFESFLTNNKIHFDMPKKSEQVLERRKLFINWYIEKEQKKNRYLSDIVKELTTIVFASETTIYSVIYDY